MTRPRPIVVGLYLLPIALIAALVGTYSLAPAFYLEVVLAFLAREHQVVEIVTFACAVVATLALAWSASTLWRVRRRAPTRGGAMIVAVIGAASFFFAGEEISWGQEYLGFQTPPTVKEHSPRLNLHNVDRLPIRVQTLASLFLVAMFFVLPAAWRLDRDERLPRDWAPAVAEGPVVFTMAVAFVWRESKVVYRWTNPGWEDDRLGHPWYWEFFEQVPEQKEMLVAVALLMCGIGRVRRARALWPPTAP